MSLATISQTALSGMGASETMLGVAANNLANLETPGFKQSQVLLATRTPTGVTGAQIGTGVQVSGIRSDISQGVLLPGTGSLSLGISGNGYFVLEDSKGQHLFTRDGTFHANGDGQLVSSNGNRVLGLQGDPSAFQGDLNPLFILNRRTHARGADSDQGSFAAAYRIGRDGVIRNQSANGSPTTMGQIRLAQFNNPGGLKSVGGNQFRATASSGPARIGNPGASGLGQLASHTYEASNSDTAQNLVGMSRAELLFRANLKVLRVANSMYEDLITLLRR